MQKAIASKDKKIRFLIAIALLVVLLIVFAYINISQNIDEAWKSIKFYDLEMLISNKWDTDASDLELNGIVSRGYYTPQHEGAVLLERLDSRLLDEDKSLREYIHFGEQIKFPNKRIDKRKIEIDEIDNLMQYKAMDIRRINGNEWKYHFSSFSANDGEDMWQEAYIILHNNYYYIVSFSYADVDNDTIDALRKCQGSLCLT